MTHAKATYVADSDFTLYVGDVREQLRSLPAESVHCVVTSPPYWGLRDYGTGVWDGGDPDCDHTQPVSFKKSTLGASTGGRSEETHARSIGAQATPYARACGKCGARRVDQQLGLEATPDLYVQNMVSVFREVRRVLRRDGTCWLNIGDSYAQGPSGSRTWEGGQQGGETSWRMDRPWSTLVGGLKPKDLVGIPWRLAFALQADGWYLRSDVIWAKPNPMPESVTDRPTKAHEYLFLLTRSPRYFYDADAIREPHTEPWRSGTDENRKMAKGTDGHGPTFGGWDYAQRLYNPAGRNRRSVWEIATEPYPDAHFATFPQALVEPCILAGTSERGCCPECGAPWEREIERELKGGHAVPNARAFVRDATGEATGGSYAGNSHVSGHYEIKTTGWRPTCECGLAETRDNPTGLEAGKHARTRDSVQSLDPGFRESVPCTVLDPFMGSGTTALVARRLGRKSIGIELNEEYARLCAHRLRQLSLLA